MKTSLVLVWLALAALLGLQRGVNGEISPDVDRNFTQIVQARGYKVEEHFVTTEDGYILRLFRIPHGKNNNNALPNAKKIPVLLQHGLLDSAFSWILNFPTQSLSYILADNNYDVWMGNSRGNIYSLGHVPPITSSDAAFWEFSWDQMASFDIPAVINYILQFTDSEKLAYIGHSQGTTQMFAALSTQPDLHEKMYSFQGFGPVVSVKYETNEIMRVLADWDVGFIVKLFGLHDFLPAERKGILKFIFTEFCYDCETCCADVIEAICGPHRGAFNDSRMPVVADHEPGGTSVQNMIHWAQMVRSGLFQKYNYGPEGNEKHYHQKTAPIYDISKIAASFPMAMYSGGNDELADPRDVAALLAQLPPQTFWQKIPSYAHLDYLWAIDAQSIMYPNVLQFLYNTTSKI